MSDTFFGFDTSLPVSFKLVLACISLPSLLFFQSSTHNSHNVAWTMKTVILLFCDLVLLDKEKYYDSCKGILCLQSIFTNDIKVTLIYIFIFIDSL